MIKEFKNVWVKTANGFRCYVDDTNYIPYLKTDLDGNVRTLAEMVAADAKNMQEFGWTLYDQEKLNVVSGWKKF